MFACDQGCTHSADSVEKYKWKQMEQNRDNHKLISPTKTLVCNCWTNDYTLDQLDAGKSVQVGNECGTVCHLDYRYSSQPVHASML